MKKLIIILSILFASGFAYSLNSWELKYDNSLNDQFNIEITYRHNNNTYTTLYLVQGSSGGDLSVGQGNEKVSFRVKPADCSGPWLNFDYYQASYDFINGCTGCGIDLNQYQ